MFKDIKQQKRIKRYINHLSKKGDNMILDVNLTNGDDKNETTNY